MVSMIVIWIKSRLMCQMGFINIVFTGSVTDTCTPTCDIIVVVYVLRMRYADIQFN